MKTLWDRLKPEVKVNLEQNLKEYPLLLEELKNHLDGITNVHYITLGNATTLVNNGLEPLAITTYLTVSNCFRY